MTVKFIDVVSMRLLPEQGRLNCVIKVDAGNGVEEWPFTYDALDTAPVTIAVKQWIIDHPEFTPDPIKETSE